MTNCSCAVADCNNNRRNVRKRMLDIGFHTFPSDPVQRQRWVKFCQREPSWQPKSCDSMCSVHFKDTDYQMSHSPLIRLATNLRRLKPDVIPTIRKGRAIPVAARNKLAREARQKLEQELYSKDDQDVDIDEICKTKYKRSGNSSSVLSKVVYRLNKFPNICAFCYKTITDESVFVPFDSQNEELQCTIGQKFDEITGETMDRTERITLNHLLPDKVCTECLDVMVKFHQYQRQLQCLRKFSYGLARLLKGSRKPLETLYQEQGSYLARVLKNLNICPGPEEKVTLERLEAEVATYGRIKKYTLFVPKPMSMCSLLHQYAAAIQRTDPVNKNSNEQGVQMLHEVNIVEKPPVTTASTSQVAAAPAHRDDAQGSPPEKNARSGQRKAENEANHARLWRKTTASTSQVAAAPAHRDDGQGSPPEKKARSRPRKAENEANHARLCPYAAICKERFADEQSLQEHIANRHKFFHCNACGVKIKFYELYTKHIESHAIARALLLSHNKKATNQELECKNCGKTFQSEQILRRHETTHAGERNYVCGTCLGVFLTSEEFGKHKCPTVEMRVETAEDPFSDNVRVEPALKRPDYKPDIQVVSTRAMQEYSSTEEMITEEEYLEEILEDDTDEKEIED
uniref:uncharacterized protein LOC120951788 isoform X1 n=1 Tax=Anopheles coluzzii TaxID=1518534 RepID=UPI0020FFF3D3|nr:uncharacterized protein LOC120951788 isoform X1 [Anopheles coluzzii]